MRHKTKKNMSTPNFACANASKIFAFGSAKYYDQETIDANDYPQEWLGEYDECQTQDDFDFCIESCKDALQQKGWDEISENDGDRSYNTHYFAERVKAVEIAGITAYVKLKAGATSGYYSGANFDWSGSLELDTVYDEYELTGRYAVTADDVINDEWLENRGTCKIQAKNIINKIYATFRALVEECEAVFEQCSENRLACIGIMSNGEGVYEDLDTERGRLYAACS